MATVSQKLYIRSKVGIKNAGKYLDYFPASFIIIGNMYKGD